MGNSERSQNSSNQQPAQPKILSVKLAAALHPHPVTSFQNKSVSVDATIFCYAVELKVLAVQEKKSNQIKYIF